ncbi:hypothetical protein [Microbulbifer variabilis]|uniref:hypothetical protein n=1 Tax=Microbulbifer variabilis TaxID=266805 RepID=UPI001CFD9970|nr:hypothetical protein [Microbulbifer variabilis]
MKFSRLIKESRLFWPREISISDGELIGEGRGTFPTLLSTWDRVEKLQDRVNEWHEIMSYAIFCGFHKQAIEKLTSGAMPVVTFDEIDFKYVGLKVIEHLSQVYPSWPKSMRHQFVHDIHS